MKKILNIIPVGVFSVIATVIVGYMLLAPISDVGESWWLSWLKFKHSDKLVHFLLFFFLILAYLYDYTKYKNPHHTRINAELALTVFASMIGLLTEVSQLVMGLGREFNSLDIIADVLGAFAALGVMRWFGGHVLRKYVFRHKSRRRRHHHHRSHHSEKSTENQNG